ncbi:MAG TPA: hypothetical protein VJ788_09330 [Gemmatimonadota bacterium]|nr:hypothetical protein [Gemmatimonadota bacterium]
MRRSGFVAAAVLSVVAIATALWAVPAAAQAPTPDTTYRVILYLAEDSAPSEVTFRRLNEVVGEGAGADRIRQLLEASSVEQLEGVTIVPGRDTPALKIGSVTVRVTGVYKEPRRDAMFLRVEVDGGRAAFVKEVVSRFDESLVLAYPLTEGNRSIIALLVPVGISP